MKTFHVVTILGLLLAVGLCCAGCGTMGSGAAKDADARALEAERLKAERLAAKVAEANRLLQEGDLDRSQGIVDEVLAEEPGHPGALGLRSRLQKTRYATIYPGDTLSEISFFYYQDVERWGVVARANGIDDPKRISAYQRLRVPLVEGADDGLDEVARLRKRFFNGQEPEKIILHPLQEGETLRALAQRFYGNPSLAYFLADFNRLPEPEGLAPGFAVEIPVFARKPVVTRPQDREMLNKGRAAVERRQFEQACKYFSSVPRESPLRKEARLSLRHCREEGASYYEKLGDDSFQASAPKDACKYWQQALALKPDRQEVKRKLEEAQDLVRTLELLPSLPQ